MTKRLECNSYKDEIRMAKLGVVKGEGGKIARWCSGGDEGDTRAYQPLVFRVAPYLLLLRRCTMAKGAGVGRANTRVLEQGQGDREFV
ncbi:hypothetical protein E2C01_045674 [Portunus trituberculatus]|uniref:Uncharacterized protein n=1 Tax=Portunus trituberculatus TaxID=210409 RepID=A0A5B7FVR6_PORTR|nr:hypothetical protein [Portunus trituberculatus]